MATNDQVNQISDGAILSSCKTAQVNERAVAEADLHAVRTLGVVGHQISSPKEQAGAKACAGIAAEGEDGHPGRMLEESLATAENPCEQGPEPLSYWIGLALLGLADNSMQPPLGNPLFLDAGLSGHGNSPLGAGLLLRKDQTDSDCSDDSGVVP
jgi:hypothetical protein